MFCRFFEKVFLFVPLAVVLCSCGHYSEDLAMLREENSNFSVADAAAVTDSASLNDVEPATGAAVPAMVGEDVKRLGDFNRILSHEYYNIAVYENDEAYDYRTAKFFTKKAVAALKGERVAPERVEKFKISDPVQLAELKEARKQLVYALKNNFVPENYVALAKAQAEYDYWLKQQGEAFQKRKTGLCKAAFAEAMSSVREFSAQGNNSDEIGSADGKREKERHYIVTFSDGNSTPDADSMAVISRIAESVKNRGDYSILIAGGKEGETLSYELLERLAAVRNVLQEKGIPPKKISLTSLPFARAGEEIAEVKDGVEIVVKTSGNMQKASSGSTGIYFGDSGVESSGNTSDSVSIVPEI